MLCLVLGALPAHATSKATGTAKPAAADGSRQEGDTKKAPAARPVAGAANPGRDALREKLRAKIASKQLGRGAGPLSGIASPSAQVILLPPGHFPFKSKDGTMHILGPSANLVNADLSDGDFRGKDLSGADLRGALFNGAQLTGTNFHGAKVMEADFSRATGLDLTGARPHPFFETHGAEPVGTVKLIHIGLDDAGRSGYPRSLRVHPKGGVLWLEGTANKIRTLFPTGTSHRLDTSDELEDSKLFAMVLDAKGDLWTFGDQAIRWYDSSTRADFADVDTRSFPATFTKVPVDVSTTPDGRVYVTLATGTQIFHRDLALGFQRGAMEIPSAWASSTLLRQIAEPSDAGLVFIGPGQDQLYFKGHGDGNEFPLKKPACGAIRGLAYGADGRFFYTQADPHGIAWADMRNIKSGFIKPAGDGDPCGIALGPDGRIWWTETMANRIGRLGADDVPEYFDLPEGTHPEELVAGPGGRLLFTVRESFRLGSIRAVAVEKAGEKPEAKESKADGKAGDGTAPRRNSGPSGWTAPGFNPRPQRVSKYPKGKARTEFLDGIAQKAEARFQARLKAEPEAPAPAKEWYAKDNGGEAVEDEKAASAPAAPGPAAAAVKDLDPRETLAALNVNLAPGAIRHILAQHAHKAKRYKSQFSAALSGEKEIEALIAQGLVAAGDAMAAIKSPPRYTFDTRGRFLTLCRREQVGRHNSYGIFRRTSKFLVVTESVDGEDGPSHDVVTAYPVSDRW